MIDYTYPMLVGGQDIPTERALTSVIERGKMMESADSVRFIVIHCSATRADRDYTPEQMLKDHKARGFRTIGYHAYIRRDGTVTYHRKWLEVGAHAKPYNRCSIGICYEGGIEVVRREEGGVRSGHTQPTQNSKLKTQKCSDTRTVAQQEQMLLLLMKLRKMFPKAKIVGHRDLPGTTPKECPCFDATAEYASL